MCLPLAAQLPLVDDVTRLNADEVDRVFNVRSKEDVKKVLALAREHDKKVSVRGTRHSMGGHTIASYGYVIDMMKMNRVDFTPGPDAASSKCVVEPGAMWADLIRVLNQHGYSPRTMQSYSTFSVGGSISVNAHGITNDHCGAEAVLRFTLIKWNGEEVLCERGAEGEAGELSGLALGGYGMFGVMVEIELKCAPNTHLHLETMQCKTSDFTATYDAVLADPNQDIEIKLARLDILNLQATLTRIDAILTPINVIPTLIDAILTRMLNLQSVDLFVFRRSTPEGMRTISALDDKPRELGWLQQILYKWVMPSAKQLRYSIERSTGKAIDWSEQNERNLLMYESATTLARFYSPFYELNDTFVLQVPVDADSCHFNADSCHFDAALTLFSGLGTGVFCPPRGFHAMDRACQAGLRPDRKGSTSNRSTQHNHPLHLG